MQQAKYPLPIWPYIGAVACLFVLTLLAPFTWRNAATSKPATWQPAAIGDVAATARLPEVASEDVVPVGDSQDLVAVFPAPRVMPVWQAPRVAANPDATSSVQVGPIELSELVAPRQRAWAAPPVADRIQMPVPSPERGISLPPAENSNTITPANRLVAVTLDTEPVRQADSPAPKRAAFPNTPHSWPKAIALIDLFRSLQAIDVSRDWASLAITTLEDIHRLKSLDAEELMPLLDTLSLVAQEGVELAQAAPPSDLRRDIVRAGYATVRRELVWRQVYRIATHQVVPNRAASPAAHDRLAAVRARLANNKNADAWLKYLRLDEVQSHFQETDAESRAALAHNVLARMSAKTLSPSQRKLMQQQPFSGLELELRRWVVEPIDYPQLLDDIETYELTRSAAAAHRIAAAFQVIRWSDDESIANLAATLDMHYRNANLRLAVRDQLLNRLLPQMEDFEEEVNEHIVGAQVYGNVQGSAHIRTVLIPDPYRWRFGLEVEGEVESQTSATRGPATFFNDGYSRYQARKLFQIDRRGVLISDSEAVANMDSELTGFRTLFDSLPIIGWVARGIARQQHDDQTEMARWVSETRLETRMRERLDAEVQAQLETAQAKVEDKIIAPLERLDLNPDAMEMRTTKERLIARYRLAGANHLGAFTPRPQAPSDSMLSVQVHESLLNNTLEQLQLAGRRTKLRQLYRDLADAFDRSDLEVPDEIREGITIQFADVDPVRVHCEDGLLTLTLQIAELSNRYNTWRQFEVRATYIPDSTDLHARLIRDGVIQLIGNRLRIGDQIALRTIFSRALSKNQPFNIINSKLAENPAIADLTVNQFVIADGWIGVALGPHRVTEVATPDQVNSGALR